MTAPHPGAKHFPLDVRRRVADGPPFDHMNHGWYCRRNDDRDLLSALLIEMGLTEPHMTHAGGGYAASQMGLATYEKPGVNLSVGYRPKSAATIAISEMGNLADREGTCNTKEKLRAFLLGS